MEVVNNFVEDYSASCIKILSEKYKFDLEEGLKHVSLNNKKEVKEVKEVKTKKGTILPFCGRINEDCCEGVKLNYGLYTQCQNTKLNKSDYCKTCFNQGVKSGTGVPTYGSIKDRLKAGANYQDKNGKTPIRYANIMKKFNISKEEAIQAAETQGLVIPEEEFEEKIVKRGRPKKEVAVSDTESEASVAPKKRGRPKKDKPIVSQFSTGDELIADLIKETNLYSENIKSTNKKDQEEIKDSNNEEHKEEKECEEDKNEDDEEEVEVAKFKHPKTGEEYYITEENQLYDTKTHEHIGKWNKEKQVIELADLSDSDIE